METEIAKNILTTRNAPFLYQPPSWFEHVDWERVFDSSKPVSEMSIHIDLGAGDGGFLIERAKRLPHVFFLGVERLLGRARKISRKASRNHLENVRVLRIEASYAVAHLFPPSTIESISILFPDPWPKRRHHKHRLIQHPFLEHCSKILKPNGWLAIKTDNTDYFKHISEILSTSPHFQIWSDTPSEEVLPELTDFERDFLKEGRSIHFIAARPSRTEASTL